MMGIDPNRAKSIFLSAVEDRAPEQWSTYLDEACQGDAELRQRVEVLLTAHQGTDKLLDNPDAALVAPVGLPEQTEAVGTIIGRYKLLERIGEGGMAVVYMAEQEQPIRRKVALKIIKLGMDTRQVIARFEVERQALAMMDHPNIAKVLDAGATETGRPYFVMELVTGVSITEYCDRNSLSTKHRLALFVQVCRAVQHAHQKGIIHRDLKPSNIMVTQRDGQPVPKVIDFGIAKATNQRLTEKTLFTRYAHIIGTPAYMSPEQAELSDLDIDTRTDIYSLGVLLYELLTGTTPFGEEELRKVGYIEMQRVIREQEPAKPSTKLSTLGERLTDIAKHRGCTPDVLRKAVRGDLDWIVVKSLEKDRSARYETAGALALDIQRHLNQEPVLAGSPGTVYRLRKWAHKHWTSFVVTSGILGGVILSLVCTTMYVHAEMQRRRIQDELGLSAVQTLHAKGQRQAALRQVETILGSRAVGREAQLLHARLLFETGQPDDAVAQLEQLLTEPPEISGAAHLLLAAAYAGTDPAKTRHHQQRAEALYPRTAEAYCLRALIATTPKETIRLLSEALELDPSHSPSYRARALAYYALGDYDAMRQDAQVLVALRPKGSLGYALRAMAYREMVQLHAAIQDHNRAINVCDSEAELAELHNQRRETYALLGNHEAALRDAKRAAELEPGQFTYRFHIFAALVSLGEYEAARQEYVRSLDSGLAHPQQFEARAMRHVFDALGAGQLLELPAKLAHDGAFSAMRDAIGFYRTLEAEGTRLVRRVYGQSSWSPDGKRLVYGRSDMYVWQAQTLIMGAPAVSRSSGIEMLDLESGTTRLLVSFGTDPAWSPDGEHIAFVSEPDRLFGRTGEIWIIPATGGEPRRVVSGACPVWARDSRKLFFHSQIHKTVCSIAIDDPAAEPESILVCPVWNPRVSPDGQYVAYAVGNELRIVELRSGAVKTRWTTPGPPTQKTMLVNWSPDAKELSLGAWSDLGLWVFDVERRKGRRIFGPPARMCIWSPDKSRMIVKIDVPFEENWLVALDPDIPTYEAVASALTPDDFLLHIEDHYARAVEADPGHADECLSKLAWMGMDYYRCGAYDRALSTLTRVDALRRSACHDVSHPRDLAFIVEALRALGRDPEAQEALARLRRVWEGCGYTQVDFTFGTPLPVPNVSSEYDEGAPRISADGLSLYFNGWLNNRPGGYGGADIWVSTRATTDDDWGTPVNLGPTVNSPSLDASPCISTSGLELYFASRRSGGYGDADLYVTRRARLSSPWEEPENLGPDFNSAAWDGAPNLSADDLSLYFFSWRDGQYPGGDIFVATRASLSEPWSQPLNVGAPINTHAYGEWASSISPDGLTLFFCDSFPLRPDGHGGGDLWVATRPTRSDRWSAPLNLGAPVNSPAREAGVSLSADGSTLYFHSDRPGGPGNWNLWQAPIFRRPADIGPQGDEDLARRLVQRYYGEEVMSRKDE
jgi:serine/threonine protein kinase/Tol biopolymer transport system component